MPVRLLREGILTSERVDLLSAHAEVFYRRLLSVVDDFGRYDANLKLLRAACFPLKDKLETESIRPWLQECVEARLVICYSVDGKDYLQVERFGQQIRAKKSKFPDLPESAQNPLAVAKQMQTDDVQVLATAHLDVGGDVGEVVFEDEDGGVGISSSDTRETEAPTPPSILPNTRAAAISILMRQNGVLGCTSQNPIVIDWAADPKVTDEVLLTAAATAKARKALNPGPSYLQPIVAELANPPPPKPRRDDWHRTDEGIARKARELKIPARAGESYAQLKDRVWSEVKRLEQQGVAA